jgi:hypothetical protein
VCERAAEDPFICPRVADVYFRLHNLGIISASICSLFICSLFNDIVSNCLCSIEEY